MSMLGGTTIDYGEMPASSLNKDKATVINGDTNEAQLHINCSAPTLFALKVTDERAGTEITVQNESPTSGFGLGKAADANIGRYVLSISGATADGKKVLANESDSKGQNIQGVALYKPNSYYVFTGPEVTPNLAPYQDLTATMKIRTWIAPISELPLTKTVKLDGLATFELVYL